ncbi:SMI1/KNR4 family protein [Metabacillus litoralis]|uniref:SMI1/KNR4 family protein n=1 Tax=Metabacillus litoralis TaxID=152268 RepID=UPI000EF56C38|nr:SMI1/KNR4 family protein [Metabacillus litoralis]
MLYKKFVEKAKQQDERNEFGQLEESTSKSLPEPVREFYNYANPVDVELRMADLTSIKLYSADSLPALQQEYRMPEEFYVVATREGDPIFIKNGKVYTAVHGAGEWDKELLFNSFNEFLENIIDQIKL